MKKFSIKILFRRKKRTTSKKEDRGKKTNVYYSFNTFEKKKDIDQVEFRRLARSFPNVFFRSGIWVIKKTRDRE